MDEIQLLQEMLSPQCQIFDDGDRWYIIKKVGPYDDEDCDQDIHVFITKGSMYPHDGSEWHKDI